MKLFETIAGLIPAGTDVTIVIRKTDSDNLTVSTIARNSSVKDEAKNIIPPFVVRGTAAELDEGYLQSIQAPVEKTIGLQTSMANFEAAEKLSREKSAAAKKAQSEQKNTATKIKEYTQQAESLSKEKKFDEAISRYQKALELAEGAEKTKIQKAIDDCRKSQQPDIFSMNFDEDEEEKTAEPANEEPEDEDSETEEDQSEQVETPSAIDFDD